MSTPRKNFNYNSPYTRPVLQYPSQSQDYISLDMGGIKQNNAAAHPSSNEKTPGNYNGKYYQQNFRNSNGKANRRNMFNNNYGQPNNRQNYQQGRFGPRKSNERRPQNQQKHHQNKSDNHSMDSFLHPSMTEDPWFGLMQRLESLQKSKITVKDSSPKAKDDVNDKSPSPDTRSSSDSDNPDDNDADSVASD